MNLHTYPVVLLRARLFSRFVLFLFMFCLLRLKFVIRGESHQTWDVMSENIDDK